MVTEEDNSNEQRKNISDFSKNRDFLQKKATCPGYSAKLLGPKYLNQY